ncbi:MAG: hypothetical protein IPJ68_00100 [Candidatus Moraniibacteriota bacterium]|nr:MAG: hypothetical protein IPJ68_00100 [Candidatus Moranbacteria bacterium]
MTNTNQKLLTLTTCLTLSFFSLAGSALAAPSISGTSGTWSHGGSVTVNGSAFGSKSPAAPLVWDHGQYANFTAAGYVGAWPNTGPGASNIVYSTGVSGVVMPHARTTTYATGSHLGVNDETGGNNVQLWTTFNKSNGQRVYVSWYSRLDPAWQGGLGSPSDGNFKTFGYSGGGYGLIVSGGTNWYHAGFLNPASSDAQYIINDDNGSTLDNPDANGDNSFHENMVSPGKGSASDASKWVKNEVEMRIYSTSGLGGGYVKAWDNGVLGINYVGKTDNWSGTSRSIGVGGYARAQGATTQRRYFADVYIDTSAARVLLCQGSTLASRGVCEPQPPTAWGASSVAVTVNAGRFTDGSTAYLYVCDDIGLCNANGTAITIAGSGGGDTTPPAAPTGLGVQ